MKQSVPLSKLEMLVMKPFWEEGLLSVREASDHLAEVERGPDYSTVQTIVGRLEKKEALRRVKKIGNAWLFEASVERGKIVGGLIDDVMALLDGGASPIMRHLVENEKIGLEEMEEIRAMILQKEQKEERERQGE